MDNRLVVLNFNVPTSDLRQQSRLNAEVDQAALAGESIEVPWPHVIIAFELSTINGSTGTLSGLQSSGPGMGKCARGPYPDSVSALLAAERLGIELNREGNRFMVVAMPMVPALIIERTRPNSTVNSVLWAGADS